MEKPNNSFQRYILDETKEITANSSRINVIEYKNTTNSDVSALIRSLKYQKNDVLCFSLCCLMLSTKWPNFKLKL